jgi:hypothetical protein
MFDSQARQYRSGDPVLAKRIAKRDGSSFAQAYNQALKGKQSLFSDLVKQYNEGIRYETELPAEYLQSGFLSRAEQEQIAKRRAKRKDFQS